MKKFLKQLLVPIVGSCIGIIVANLFNPFTNISSLSPDQAYDICIGLYFTLADIFIEFLINSICSHFCSSEIVVIISPPGVAPSIRSSAIIRFCRDRPAKAMISLHVHGKRTQFSNTQVIIPAIGFATIQQSICCKGVKLDKDGNYIIKIYDLLGQSEIVDIQKTFELLLIKEPSENTQSEKIYPRVSGKKRTVRFQCNYADVQTED